MADVKTSVRRKEEKEAIVKINERTDVEKLIKLIVENNLSVRRDESFLYKILKPTNFNSEWAFNRLRSYDEFLKKHTTWRNLKKSDIITVLQSGVMTITKEYDNDKRRVIWIRSSMWDPSKIDADTVLKVSGFLLELLMFDWTAEEFGSGFVLILDMDQLGMSHVYGISTSFAQKLVNFVTLCLHVPVKQVHICNEPWLCSLLFAIFNVFLDDQVQEYISFHGIELTNMQKNVSVLALPDELGGVSEVIPSSHWIELLENSEIQNELKVSGYCISDD